MQVTIDLPENLAVHLQSNKERLEKIVELGLREFRANSLVGYKSLAEVLEMLAGLPTAEEVMALRPSEKLQNEISELLEKNRREGLNEAEEQTWESYEFIEHLVRIAKAKARKQLNK